MLLLLQVVYTSGSLMRVTVVARKHQQLMETRTAELQSSVTNVSEAGGVAATAGVSWHLSRLTF
jgi:hypothetical protein